MWKSVSVEIRVGLRDYEGFWVRDKVNKVVSGWVTMGGRVGDTGGSEGL